MRAGLIHINGSSAVKLPNTMGQPKEGQFLGTPEERLTEVACRICYDSMGLSKSRNSEQLHFHIQDAPNLSVYEHANVTLKFPAESDREALLILAACVGRKGVSARRLPAGLHITANLRAVLEWDKVSLRNSSITNLVGLVKVTRLGNSFKEEFKRRMPLALSRLVPGEIHYYESPGASTWDDSERFISVWLYGSRGFTHEMVRHRFAMSQRSTRFVDELPVGWYEEDGHTLGWEECNPELNSPIKCEGEFIVHPLTKKFIKDETVNIKKKEEFFDRWMELKKVSRGLYKYLVENLQEYVGGDSTNARKQGRGAARLVLPNALASEMVYTASVNDWHWIISQRAVTLADAEIRDVIVDVLRDTPEIGREYSFQQAPDGLGYIAERTI